MDYGSNIQMTLFWCQWVKQPGGVDVEKFGLTCQPRQCRLQGSQDHTWVPATRVAQVLYYADPENPKRHVVISGKQRILGVDGVEDLRSTISTAKCNYS